MKNAIRGYELQEQIGEGGFGAVYRAYQPSVGREVAIKVILPKYANHPDFIRRFEAEAQLVARLEHPFIIPLHDYWREPDGAYLVMRYLRGGNLLTKLSLDGPLTREEAGRLVDQVASALTVAHRQGVIHRDLKPANILLDEDCNAYLTDFGIAKDISRDSETTREGAIIGSPAYLSPEQINTDPVTPLVDIYALGLVIFEALTGSQPFPDSNTPQLLIQHLHQALPSIQSLRPDLPEIVDYVIQKATAKNPADRYQDVQQLAAAFRRTLWDTERHKETQTVVIGDKTTPLQITLTNPYKGLRAFQEADAGDFFGREQLTQQLIDRLDEDHGLARFLAVVGPSGSGKSSVVRAGLLTALRQGALPGSDKWFMVEILPGARPLEELEVAMIRVSASHRTNLIEQLQRDERGLIRAAKLILPPETELLLVVDQLEEVFTLVEDGQHTRHFLDLLFQAVTDPRSRVRVVVTLRADFYDRPLMYPEFGDLVRQRTEVIMPMTASELERAIVAPAEQIGLQVEAGLVAAMVADVNEEPGALPMFQYALTELFDRRDLRTLTLGSYQDLGGVMGVLTRRADEVYSRLDHDQQQAARQLFLRLVTLGEGTEDTRRRAHRAELVSAIGEIAASVINAFEQSRLLTSDHNPLTREPTVEVAHEAILREWGQLRAWLDENRHDVRQQRLLAAAAKDWLNADRDSSYLLHGSKLEQFRGWAAETELALTGEERDYLNISHAEQQRQAAEERGRQERELHLARQAANRLRYLVSGLAVFLVVAVALALLALAARSTAQDQRDKAEREARINRSLVLAARAGQLFEIGETGLALALALESVRIDAPPPEAEQALATIAFGPGTSAIFKPHNLGVKDVSFSSDSRYAISGSCDQHDLSGTCTSGTLILWDVAERIELRRFEGHTDAVNTVAFGADDQVIISGSADTTIRLWDVETATELRRFEGHTDAVNSVAFGSNDQVIISGSADTTIRLWDVETATELSRFEGHTAEINLVAFDPASGTIFSASTDATIRLWDAEQGTELGRLQHNAAVLSFALSPDGQQLLSAADDFSVRLWDTASGDTLHHQIFAHTPFDVAITPDGRTALIALGHHALEIWDIEEWHSTRRLLDQPDAIGTIALSPDGRKALSGSRDGTLILWILEVEADSRPFNNARMPMTSVVTAPDGQHLLTGTIPGNALVWNIASGDVSCVMEGDEGATDVVVSPDGVYALVSSGDYFGGSDSRSLILWNIEHCEPVRRFEGHIYYLRSLAFSPDGSRALSGSYTSQGEGELMLWNIDTGDMIRQFNTTQDVTRIAFSIDGQRAITSSAFHTSLTLWDVETGEVIRRFPYTESVLNVVFGPSDTTVISSSMDGMVVVWDVETGTIIRRYQGHTGGVWGLALSPDGQQLVSSDDNGAIILWDFESGKTLRRFQGPRLGVYGITFSLDGDVAFSTSLDGSLVQWRVADLPLAEVIEWVHTNRHIPDFTCEQRAQYRIEPLCE